MVSAWTCDSLSWFQSTIIFTKKLILNYCSVWAVGTTKHQVLLVVSGMLGYAAREVLRLNASFVCFLGRKNV